MSARQEVPAATAAVFLWRQALAALVQSELGLAEAMTRAAAMNLDLPRDLVIAVENQRAEVARLFEFAANAIDAQSPERTGMTSFGDV